MSANEPVSVSATRVAPTFVPAVPVLDDDVALGFECAYPQLQIACWGQDDPGSAREFY